MSARFVSDLSEVNTNHFRHTDALEYYNVFEAVTGGAFADLLIRHRSLREKIVVEAAAAAKQLTDRMWSLISKQQTVPSYLQAALCAYDAARTFAAAPVRFKEDMHLLVCSFEEEKFGAAADGLDGTCNTFRHVDVWLYAEEFTHCMTVWRKKHSLQDEEDKIEAVLNRYEVTSEKAPRQLLAVLRAVESAKIAVKDMTAFEKPFDVKLDQSI